MKLLVTLLLLGIFPGGGSWAPLQKHVKDYSINDTLFIENEPSILKSVGDLKKYYVETYEDGETVYMLNKDRNECLKMIYSPGNSINSFAEFEVLSNHAPRKLFYQSKFASFATESGVRLGMPDSAFFRIKGKPQNTRKQADGTVVYEYRSADDVLYYFRAWIKNGVVQKFRFGLENP